jgi:Exostosin family
MADKQGTVEAVELLLAGRVSTFRKKLDDLLLEGRRQYRLGNLPVAAERFNGVIAIHAGNVDALRHLRLIADLLDPKPIEKPQILWRCWRNGLHELDWLKWLMGDENWNAELKDAASPEAPRIVICIDNAFHPPAEEFYRKSFLAGDRILLIHLGDEHLTSNYDSYRWCHAVWRNYWSPAFERQSVVRAFPLGYKKGFQRDREPLPAEARTLTWSFAGDAYKQSRPAMLQHMSTLDAGFVHATERFGDPNGLSTGDYRDLMERSIYIPCPRGNSNLDSFRVYEALEAGCIPVVEERPAFAYFTAMYGAHPMPVVLDWSEAPALIRGIRTAGGEERLRRACHAWWVALKARLRHDFAADLTRLAGPLY